MNNEKIKDCLEKIRVIFPKAFINMRNELIIEPKNNIYFRLDDIKDDTEFKCKMIAWLSRPSCKGVSNYYQRRILKGLNEYLGTEFTKEDMIEIYTRLGNDVNRSLCNSFIESNYNLELLIPTHN